MRSDAIETLMGRFRDAYGKDALSLYGATPDEEHGTCFTIRGVAASFSVHTQDGALQAGRYDRLMEVAALISGPRSQWPSSW